MEDDNKMGPAPVGQKTRRAFVKTAAQVAVTAPAVAMILSASTKKASAQVVYDGVVGDDGVIGDDTEETEVSGTFDGI